ncbi:MAG: ssDNA-binding protein, mitochondrial [Icmadophila ericetorum]|nr:ssDNA-binding protein, mitochondrial [Icmadophila ericetorum]
MPPRIPLPRSLLCQTRTAARAFSSTPRPQIAKITIVGRLAAEPELTSTSTGQDMVRYAVGTSYGPRENRQTSWWRVASFVEEGKGREKLMGLAKGTLIYLEGEASMRKYESKDGKIESALSIVQQRLEILKRPEGAASAASDAIEGM